MNAELLQALYETTLAISVAMLLVLCLRKPLLSRFGASIAYAAWALVPAAWLAVLLPAPRMQVTPMTLLSRVEVLQPALVMDNPAMPSWQVLVIFTWALGAVVTAGLFWWQQQRFLQSIRGSELRADGLCLANGTEGLPAVIGALRPRVVLPADFDARYDDVEQELILCHERIHIARRDLQANALFAVIRALYWFNPLVHFAARRFRRDQELACDERVVARHPDQRRSYANAMLKTHMESSPLPVGCHWQASTPLKERIEMLKKHAVNSKRSFAGALLVSILVLASGYAAWAAQPVQTPRANAPVTNERTPAPVYPAEAAEQKISGSVILLVDVAEDGSVSNVVIEKSQPEGVFDATTLEAVKQWKFQPAIKNGKPVTGRVRVPVTFEADEPEAAPPVNQG